MKRESNAENISINKDNQKPNQFIKISFNHHIECLLKAGIYFECNSSSGTTACYKSQRSNKQNTTKPTFSKFLKLKKIRSNQVSPAEMKPEIKSKSQVRKFASNLMTGLRKSFGSLRQACISNRNPLGFRAVPIYFHR